MGKRSEGSLGRASVKLTPSEKGDNVAGAKHGVRE